MTQKRSQADKLKTIIRARPKALVAFSGGVDSTLLLKVCRDVLGPANVTAVTGVSQTYTPEEKRAAVRAARELGVRHVLIETDELACAAFAANPADRCYHCKRELFGRIAGLARTLGIDAFYDASNIDDLADYRPGRRATEEFGVVSPLVEAGFSKKDVRALSKRLGLDRLGQAGQSVSRQPHPLRHAHHRRDPGEGPSRREVLILACCSAASERPAAGYGILAFPRPRRPGVWRETIHDPKKISSGQAQDHHPGAAESPRGLFRRRGLHLAPEGVPRRPRTGQRDRRDGSLPDLHARRRRGRPGAPPVSSASGTSSSRRTSSPARPSRPTRPTAATTASASSSAASPVSPGPSGSTPFTTPRTSTIWPITVPGAGRPRNSAS